MKIKIFLVLFILFCIFGASPSILAQTMTAAQKQALIAQIQQQIAQLTLQLQQMLAQQQGTASWCYTFNNNLGYANSGTVGVANLHIALQKEGISYSPDSINVYSSGTLQAVIQFQAKYGILPQTGYVGPLTRVKLNQLYGCSYVTQNPPATTNCTQNYQEQCSGNSVHWYDSCGNLGNLAQQCSSSQTCSNGSCVTNVNNCTQNYQEQCSGNSVYWYDSCGNLGNLAQQCSSNQTCSNGSCVTTSTTSACIANCVTQSDGIYAVDCSGNATKCNTGEVCNKTYSTTYTYNNGGVQTINTLTGSQCATPTPVLTTISITPTTASLTVGGNTEYLSAHVLDQNGDSMDVTLTWTSSDPSVATVDSYGTVTPLSAGTTIVTAHSGSVTSNQVVVTVTTSSVPVLARIIITQTSPNNPGILCATSYNGPQQLTAQTLDQNGNPISATLTWTSSDPSVATVSSSNDYTALVTPVATGTVTITASSGSVTSNQSTFTVEPFASGWSYSSTPDGSGNYTCAAWGRPCIVAYDFSQNNRQSCSTQSGGGLAFCGDIMYNVVTWFHSTKSGTQACGSKSCVFSFVNGGVNNTNAPQSCSATSYSGEAACSQ